MQESDFQPGDISNVEISAGTNEVQAVTSYEFVFAPSSDIPAYRQSKIEIDIPDSLAFTNSYCTIEAQSSDFSNSMSCAISGQRLTLSYIFSNKPAYEGGTELSVTIGEITNAASVQDVGDFVISSYIRVSSTYYLVDQATVSGQVTTEGGTVTKLSDIEATSYATADASVTYTFDIEFEHDIPVGGLVRVVLPGSMKVGNQYTLQSNCYRIDYSSSPISLSCDAYDEYFDILIADSDFGNNGGGLPGGEQLRLRIGGLTNPRSVGVEVFFSLTSYDEDGRKIDLSTD